MILGKRLDIVFFCRDDSSFPQSKIFILSIYTHLCLRYPNTESEHPKDRIFKINPFVNIIIEQCQKYYLPEREIPIDESMILFHRRNKLAQFKPTRYEFKAVIVNFIPKKTLVTKKSSTNFILM